tara:strand:+ start:862 stop:1158 length:297 start_codon:yes stop_codon:yes gene_type:complete
MTNGSTKLPAVLEDICKTFIRDVFQRVYEGTEDQFMRDIQKNVSTENPTYILELLDFGKTAYANRGKELKAFADGFIMGYELLRRQAETNEFEQQFDE